MDIEIEILLGNKVKHTRIVPNTFNQYNKFKIPILKQKNTYEEDVSSSEDDDLTDSYEAMEEEDDDDERMGSVSGTSSNQKKLLRRYGGRVEDDLLYSLTNNKKPKKELTEEDIAKKTEQMRIRKIHAKRQLEEEKRETIERILNEDGRKLRERQKKANEDNAKKEQALEQKYRFSLTKIKHKYQKDGSVYVRFPQGFLLPHILIQKGKEYPKIIKCDVDNCINKKRYTDPITKKNYCSVNCFRIIRECLNN